jgi:hypothetical protein
MILCLEPLLNDAFSNGSFKKPLLNDYAAFLGLIFALTFTFLLSPIIFVLMNCPSHRSLISIQCFKNKNLKTEISRITNPFLYIKREMRERQREKEERRETEKIKIEIRPSQLQTAIIFYRKL